MKCQKCGHVMQEGKGEVRGWLDDGSAYIISQVKLYSCPNDDDLAIEVIPFE